MNSIAIFFILSAVLLSLWTYFDTEKYVQSMPIMRVVWILTMLWASWFGLIAYLSFGRPKYPQKPVNKKYQITFKRNRNKNAQNVANIMNKNFMNMSSLMNKNFMNMSSFMKIKAMNLSNRIKMKAMPMGNMSASIKNIKNNMSKSRKNVEMQDNMDSMNMDTNMDTNMDANMNMSRSMNMDASMNMDTSMSMDANMDMNANMDMDASMDMKNKSMPMSMSMPMEQKSKWQGVTLSTLHCGAGCMLADIIGETVSGIVGITLIAGWGLDYILALLIGVYFQYVAIQQMERIEPKRAFLRALKADFLSLTSWQIGMYVFMLTFIQYSPETVMNRASFQFWFLMQFAMLTGFFLAYPMNVLLIKLGIKHAM